VTVWSAAGIATWTWGPVFLTDWASAGAVDDAEAQAVMAKTGATAPESRSSSGGRRALRVMPLGRLGVPPGSVLESRRVR
jgi:hypothetical protein